MQACEWLYDALEMSVKTVSFLEKQKLEAIANQKTEELTKLDERLEWEIGYGDFLQDQADELIEIINPTNNQND